MDRRLQDHRRHLLQHHYRPRKLSASIRKQACPINRTSLTNRKNFAVLGSLGRSRGHCHLQVDAERRLRLDYLILQVARPHRGHSGHCSCSSSSSLGGVGGGGGFDGGLGTGPRSVLPKVELLRVSVVVETWSPVCISPLSTVILAFLRLTGSYSRSARCLRPGEKALPELRPRGSSILNPTSQLSS